MISRSWLTGKLLARAERRQQRNDLQIAFMLKVCVRLAHVVLAMLEGNCVIRNKATGVINK